MSDFTQDPFDFTSDFVERVLFSRQRRRLLRSIPYGELAPDYVGLVTAPTIIPYGELDATKVL